MSNEKAKKHTKGKIIAWSIVAAVLIITLIIAMGSAEAGFSFSVNSFMYKNEKSYNIGAMEYPEFISELDINWAVGNVEIVPYEGETVKIEETGANSEKNQLRSKIYLGRLTIQYAEAGIRFFQNIPEKNLKIYIPAKNAGSISYVDVDMASANLKIEGITIGELNLDMASGSANIKAEVDRLEVDTASGSVNYVGNSKDVEIDAASGSITLTGSYGELSIDAASSKITLNGVAKSAEIDTSSGDIILNIPEGTEGVNAMFETASGDMVIKKDGNTYSARSYSDGAVKYRYEIDTSSGDVELIIN